MTPSNPTFSNFELKASDFGSDFIWGVSTAAYQIEGAHNSADKGESIWDRFTRNKKNIYQGQNGHITCDFYNRYKEDILLMRSMNIRHFRFSLSWSRLIPEGQGQLSIDGIDFYNRVIDICLECGITPWITLYHWDLPQALEEKGGWTNRNILNWFEAYTRQCGQLFGDRVKHWIVLNEPMVFTGAGYFLGVHAPGKKGLRNFLPAVHHATLCQALGGKVLRDTVEKALIGTTFSCSQITPYSQKEKDVKASRKADALLNRLFIEPSLGMGYPVKDLKVLRRMEKHQKPEDQKNMIFDFDFIGIQNYTREVVKHSFTVPYLRSKIVNATKRNVPTTLMDWEVYPKSIHAMISQFNSYEGIKKLIITENGAAFEDNVLNGEVHDPERLSYLQEYIKEVHRAKEEGLGIAGYFVWTFIDNFEWAEGFYPRFGLVHNNFKTQKRLIKTSGKWYSSFLKNH
ncbi:GH1 family beta-glucosidase [Maribacter polysiphoniae]|uniref:GH1 family beta-glucosidase n=1 Tax=Maribacter polysiphoniae TaxID=429344 RepID=UPI0023556933|nr:GH1 family beta-glucosidase [Maribacter polysiphoniae]